MLLLQKRCLKGYYEAMRTHEDIYQELLETYKPYVKDFAAFKSRVDKVGHIFEDVQYEYNPITHEIIGKQFISEGVIVYDIYAPAVGADHF